MTNTANASTNPTATQAIEYRQVPTGAAIPDAPTSTVARVESAVEVVRIDAKAEVVTVNIDPVELRRRAVLRSITRRFTR